MSGALRGLRSQAPTLLVAGLAGSFGTALLQLTGLLAASIRADPAAARSHDAVPALLNTAAIVFIAIAIYVSAIVTSNTVATVVAGRTREIALLRLIGSSARSERVRIAREGLLLGLAGSALGVLVGSGAAALLGELGVSSGQLDPYEYSYLNPIVALPFAAVTLTTWLAAWTGSRRVLSVRAAQALGNAVEQDRDEAVGSRARNVVALVLVILGAVLLALGLLAGLVSVFGVFIGLIGGVVSFTGIVLAAGAIVPPALRLVGRAFGRSRVAVIAAENAVRHPERSTRMTLGLVIGVTLVTTFAVTIQSFQNLIDAARRAQPEVYSGLGPVLQGVTTVFSVLVGFSALIAAVGLVNALSLNVLQRSRELGLMRALGFDRGQLGLMILIEAAALTVTACALGLMLGFAYGWVGAQSLLGSIQGSPGVVAPGVPWPVVGAILGTAAVLTLLAAVAPARRATRVSPVVALAVE